MHCVLTIRVVVCEFLQCHAFCTINLLYANVDARPIIMIVAAFKTVNILMRAYKLGASAIYICIVNVWNTFLRCPQSIVNTVLDECLRVHYSAVCSEFIVIEQ